MKWKKGFMNVIRKNGDYGQCVSSNHREASRTVMPPHNLPQCSFAELHNWGNWATLSRNSLKGINFIHFILVLKDSKPRFFLKFDRTVIFLIILELQWTLLTIILSLALDYR